MQLRTKYEIGEIPHAEHPLPQCERESWQNLNGKWTLSKHDASGKRILETKIRVPFSPETLKSGVKEGFVLGRGEVLTYRREVVLDETMLQGTTLLHFGAVDSECQVFWNGLRVGGHRGGFTAFTLDVSAFATEGTNELLVKVTDEATRNGGARGKQSDRRGGIWYTPQSGIWQTVWMESMPKSYIHNLKITPNAEDKTVQIASESFGEMQTVTVLSMHRMHFQQLTHGFVQLMLLQMMKFLHSTLTVTAESTHLMLSVLLKLMLMAVNILLLQRLQPLQQLIN